MHCLTFCNIQSLDLWYCQEKMLRNNAVYESSVRRHDLSYESPNPADTQHKWQNIFTVFFLTFCSILWYLFNFLFSTSTSNTAFIQQDNRGSRMAKQWTHGEESCVTRFWFTCDAHEKFSNWKKLFSGDVQCTSPAMCFLIKRCLVFFPIWNC